MSRENFLDHFGILFEDIDFSFLHKKEVGRIMNLVYNTSKYLKNF
jgi:hypothetical protein